MSLLHAQDVLVSALTRLIMHARTELSYLVWHSFGGEGRVEERNRALPLDPTAVRVLTRPESIQSEEEARRVERKSKGGAGRYTSCSVGEGRARGMCPA